MRQSPKQNPRQEIAKHFSAATETDPSQHGHRQARPNPRSVSLLCALPAESRTHVTSYLDPRSLLALGQTCRLLHAHVAGERTWQRAFLCQFLGVAPEDELGDDSALLLRRQQPSWRLEFAFRHRMRARWQRSRNPTVVHAPVQSYVCAMHALANGGILTCSLRYGVVTRSHPLTGKVVKGFLSASGGGAGIGIGNPNLEFAPDATACALASEGTTANVAWGYRNGQVSIVTAKKAMQGKVPADFVRCRVADYHDGPVVHVVWDQDLVVSAADDGRIKVWQKRHGEARCLWSSARDEAAVIPPKCVKVASALVRGYIACVMDSGDVLVWRGFVLGDPKDAGTPRLDASNVAAIRVPSPLPALLNTPALPDVIAFHADRTAAEPTLLLAYRQHPFFYRVTATGPADIRTATFGDPAFALTSVAPCFRAVAADGERSFVLAGEHLGTVAIYDWSASGGAHVAPMRKLDAHPDGAAVTALACDGTVLVAGSARGSLHAFDALTLARVRTFDALEARGVGAGGGGGDGSVSPLSAVSHVALAASGEMLLAAVGSEVLAWKAGAVPRTTRHIVVGAREKGRAGRERARYEQKMEVREGMAAVGDGMDGIYKRDARGNTLGQINSLWQTREARGQQAKLATMGLDEAEALEYVMMLSREEEEGVGVDDGSSFADVADGSFADVDDGSLAGTGDSSGSSGVSSLSYASSSAGSPSYGRRASPPAGRPISPSASAALAPSNPPDPAPSTSPVPATPPSQASAPSGRRASASSVQGASVPSVKRASAPKQGGSPSSAHSGSSSSAWSSPSSVKRASPPSSSAWARPLRMTPGDAPASSAPAGPSSGGARRGADLALPSARASSSIDGSEQTSSADDEMDDDLRYALELSLAEARSRGEAV
ncbi:hypothetical protein HDZ31DRAFT_44082 [Schizophyllum fasciatum]